MMSSAHRDACSRQCGRRVYGAPSSLSLSLSLSLCGPQFSAYRREIEADIGPNSYFGACVFGVQLGLTKPRTRERAAAAKAATAPRREVVLLRWTGRGLKQGGFRVVVMRAPVSFRSVFSIVSRRMGCAGIRSSHRPHAVAVGLRRPHQEPEEGSLGRSASPRPTGIDAESLDRHAGKLADRSGRGAGQP